MVMTQLKPQMTKRCTIHMLPIKNMVRPERCSRSGVTSAASTPSFEVTLVDVMLPSLEPSRGIGLPYLSKITALPATAVAAVLAVLAVLAEFLLSTSDSGDSVSWAVSSAVVGKLARPDLVERLLRGGILKSVSKNFSRVPQVSVLPAELAERRRWCFEEETETSLADEKVEPCGTALALCGVLGVPLDVPFISTAGERDKPTTS